MKNIIINSKCYRCKHSFFKESHNTKKTLLECGLNRCYDHALFQPEDWRDLVMLEQEWEGMPAEDRHRKAEFENPHIVAVYHSNLLERRIKEQNETAQAKRKRQILAQIKRDGGIDGMKLIAKAE